MQEGRRNADAPARLDLPAPAGLVPVAAGSGLAGVRAVDGRRFETEGVQLVLEVGQDRRAAPHTGTGPPPAGGRPAPEPERPSRPGRRPPTSGKRTLLAACSPVAQVQQRVHREHAGRAREHSTGQGTQRCCPGRNAPIPTVAHPARTVTGERRSWHVVVMAHGCGTNGGIRSPAAGTGCRTRPGAVEPPVVTSRRRPSSPCRWRRRRRPRAARRPLRRSPRACRRAPWG